MTHNIQSNYMVPWKAVKSLPPVYLTGLLVPQTGRALEPGSVNLHWLWQYRTFVPSCIFPKMPSQKSAPLNAFHKSWSFLEDHSRPELSVMSQKPRVAFIMASSPAGSLQKMKCTSTYCWGSRDHWDVVIIFRQLQLFLNLCDLRQQWQSRAGSRWSRIRISCRLAREGTHSSTQSSCC